MPHLYDTDDIPVIPDRRAGPHGEVVLRRHGELLQIIANGCFLMDTSDGRSERLLVDAAYDALDGRPEPGVLIGGPGVGFFLGHAATDRRSRRITVVERERAIIDWHLDGPLSIVSREAFAEPRARVLEADLVDYVKQTSDTYDALRPRHRQRARPDSHRRQRQTVLRGWTGKPRKGVEAARGARSVVGRVISGFEGTLWDAGFRQVRTEEVPVARGLPGVVHLAVRPE